MKMKKYNHEELTALTNTIDELFGLFNRAAFKPEFGYGVDKPIDTFNAVYQVRTELQKRDIWSLPDRAREFFEEKHTQLLAIEGAVYKKNAMFCQLAEFWRDKRITPSELVTGTEALGETYWQIGGFIREQNGMIRESIDEKQPILGQEIMDQLKQRVILFLAANPSDQIHLHTDKEFEQVKGAVGKSAGFRLALPLLSTRPTTFSQVLLDERPEFVHFAGHGKESGELCFEDELGETHPVEPEALAALLKLHTDFIKCVLLMACNSKAQAEAIAVHLDYVIGMDGDFSDEAAIAFTIGFYQALAADQSVKQADQPVKQAYEHGLAILKMNGIPEDTTPVLRGKALKTSGG
jgi:hypothetical protein